MQYNSVNPAISGPDTVGAVLSDILDYIKLIERDKETAGRDEN